MGTNYYRYDNGDHIGKAFSNGQGRGITFMWAAKREDIVEMCLSTPGEIVADEGDCTGKKSGGGFLSFLIFEVTDHDFSQVGTEFY